MQKNALAGNAVILNMLEHWEAVLRLIAVVRAAKEREKHSPTPDSYVGGQSAFSQTLHQLDKRIKKALAALEGE